MTNASEERNSWSMTPGNMTPESVSAAVTAEAELSGTDWKVTQKGLAHVTPIVAGMSKAEESGEIWEMGWGARCYGYSIFLWGGVLFLGDPPPPHQELVVFCLVSG